MSSRLLVRELTIFLMPFAEAFSEPVQLAAFCRSIGHPITVAEAEQVLAGIGSESGELSLAFEAVADSGVDIAKASAVALGLVNLLDAVGRLMSAAAGTDESAIYAALFDRLLRLYLGARLPFLTAVLEGLGVIVEPNVPSDLNDPTPPQYAKVRFDWSRIVDFVDDTGDWAREVYGWGDAGGFDHVLAMSRIANLVEALQMATTHVRALTAEESATLLGPIATGRDFRIDLPVAQADFIDVDLDGAPRFGTEVGVTLLPFADPADRTDQGLAVTPYVTGTTEVDLSVEDNLRLTAAVRAQSPPAVRPVVAFTPRGTRVLSLDTAGRLVDGVDSTFRFEAELSYSNDPGRPLWSVGDETGSRVEGHGVRFRVGCGTPGDFEASVSVRDIRVVVDLASDGLLRSFLDAPVRIPIGDLTLGWSSERGGFVNVGLSPAGFAISRSVDVDLGVGPVRVRTTDLALRLDTADSGGPSLVASVRAQLELSLGPVRITVNSPGIALSLSLAAGADDALRVDPIPPVGATLAIASGPVSGSGSIQHDPATGRYSGALALQLSQIAVRGVALLDTRLPGGRRGFSLLVMLSARFDPGIQLGFGVTLTAVGGLVGVNRRIDVDALRERFAAGTAARVLDPPDPARALATQLPELAAIFPPAEGVVVIGPTVRLQWARLVTIDAGLFIELPGPTKVVLLGTARAEISNPLARGPLLQLRADFVGVVDLDRRTIAFDAVLVDSRLLEVFAITGGMALRADFGDDDPYLLLTVGGFHPDFTPPRLAFPATLTRLAMSHGSPGDRLYLRFEGYFAITPNTMQFGAAVEVSAKLGPLRIKGFLGFDTLVRFEPFFFTIDFRASLRVQVRGRNLAGVKVTGTISGPGPVTVRARACVSILFFDICGSATFELGSKAPPRVSPAPSAFEVIADELRKPVNVRAAGTDDRVALHEPPAGGVPVLPPTGLIWQQSRVPLGLLLERFEGIPLRRAETVTATSAHADGEAREWFAPGSYAELSDAEAVNRRTFERLPAGLRVGTGADVASDALEHPVEVEEILIPRPPTPPTRPRPGTTLPPWLLDALDLREARPDRRVVTPLVRVAEESWTVRTRTGRIIAESESEAYAHQLARTTAGAVATPVHDTVTLPHL